MRIKELCQSYPMWDNVKTSNCLMASKFRLAVLGNTKNALCMQMADMSDKIIPFPYKMEIINVPMTKPSTKITKKADMFRVYNENGLFHKQTLTLDPLYAAEFSDQPIDPQSVSITWSPDGCSLPEAVLAIVTSYGACEIMKYDRISRDWNSSVVRVNDYLESLYTPDEKIKNFNKLRDAVDLITITSCCWNELPSGNGEAILYCSNAAGYIFAFKIIAWECQLMAKIETDLGYITTLNICKDLLIVSNRKGLIKSFSIQNTKIEQIDTLWSNPDLMAPSRILTNYCPNVGKYFVATAKAAHFVAFVLSAEGHLEHKITHYVGNMKITNIDSFSPTEYIVTTASGYIAHIKLIHTKSNLQTIAEEVKVDFDTENFNIMGMTLSPNKTICTFVFCASKIHLGPTKHIDNSIHISVGLVEQPDPLAILLKGYEKGLNELIDCVAAVRLQIWENPQANDYHNFNPQPVQISEEFFHRLRVKLLIINSIGAHNRKKFGHRGQTNESEFNSFLKCIQVVHIWNRLNYLVSIQNRTEFQNLAGKCMFSMLKIDQKTASSSTGEISRSIRDILSPLIDSLLEQHESEFTQTEEKCSFCDSTIDFETMDCPHEHNMPRCCFSYIQVPTFNQRHCPNCSVHALDDECALLSLMRKDEPLRCPYCYISFVTTPWGDAGNEKAI